MNERYQLNGAFASDNSAGVHPIVLSAAKAANKGHVIGYGDDTYTYSALKTFRHHFGKDLDVYFVFGGIGANVVALKAATQPCQAIICAETAHINVDECGAVEQFTGCELVPVPSRRGKVSIDDVRTAIVGVKSDQHHAQPRVISISQATEMGTVYTKREVKALAHLAHKNKMLLHVDGARLANAAVSLDAKLRGITRGVGVDVLSFGGAKNGMMYGEAVLFFNRKLSQGFEDVRRQGGQLASKMRFISAQFEALLSNDLWKTNAAHANSMARLLARKLSDIPQVKTDLQDVQANSVFACIPKRWVQLLQKEYYFHVWDKKISQVRFVTSFATTKEDIHNLIASLERISRK
jgi:threonine aldolase